MSTPGSVSTTSTSSGPTSSVATPRVELASRKTHAVRGDYGAMRRVNSADVRRLAKSGSVAACAFHCFGCR